MSDPDEPKKSATETLAALVAQRKAAASGAPGPGGQGRKQTERVAAAKAASKSRPALRKN